MKSLKLKWVWSLSLVTIWIVVASAFLSAALQQDNQDNQQAAKQDGEDDGKAQQPSKKKELKTKKKAEVSLMDQEPFDLLILDEENDNAELKIYQLESIPANPEPTDKIRIRLLILPDRKFDVMFEHIVAIRTFEQLVFEEAKKLVAKKDYNEAFRHYDYLMKNSRRTSGLLNAVREFIYDNSLYALEEERYDYALALLEELYRFAPNYRRTEVTRGLSRIADTFIKDAVDRGDYRSARGIIVRMSEQYDPGDLPTLGEWQERLVLDAQSRKTIATKHMNDGDYRAAHRVGRDMIKIWPDLPGAKELTIEISRRHPMVIVGVDQLAKHYDSRLIENWAARRSGRLLERTLLEFIGAGPEGGQYNCSLGAFDQSDDRRRLTFDMTPDDPRTALITGFDVASRLSQLANPDSSAYVPSWAALTREISVSDVFQVNIDLRRPHVLPEAMLQVVLQPDAQTRPQGSPSEGAFVIAETTEDETRFLANPRFEFEFDSHLKEIVERRYENPEEAIVALKRGDIDILDQVFPADVLELRAAETVVVDSYTSPTLHFLVPNYNRNFVDRQIFRRAIAYGINRHDVLYREVLGNMRIDGFEVISGPFPLGVGDNDPLAYAYDVKIKPRNYNPQLSVVLQEMAQRELKEIANKRGEEVPELEKLIIAYPGEQVARVACQAIANYLKIVGIETDVRELPPGQTRPDDDEWDLLYVQAAIWEPIVDARRLLGPTGVAGIENEYLGMGLRRLDESRNWREARDRLHDLHRIVHEQVSVIPLFQTINFYAYYKGLEGYGARPVTLYQNAEHWQVVPRAPRE